jgi:butyryl-CoA dehydrogenase
MTDSSLIDSFRDFAERDVRPAAGEVDRSGKFPADRWKKLGEYGLTGLVIPEGHGGLGADRSSVLAALEALAGACGSTAWTLIAHSTVAAGIAALGSSEQKQRYLPALARADLIGGTLAVTETGGGSNPASIRTFACAEKGGYVLNGGKFFISQAGAGDIYLVVARTDHAPGPRSLSCFVIERADSGLSFGPRERTMGMRGVQVREVIFDDCRVPAERLLGETGGGLAVLGAVLSWAQQLPRSASHRRQLMPLSHI